ncbi:CopG family transcriptional regulator [Candidatus Bathyarchaeota archaeon]|nr:CopG family transcriptional regulator [Candidatus Bathyarchaeota archaeon]
MSGYTTISTKVPLEVKEKLKKLGLKPSKVLRKAIEDAIMEEEVKRLKESIEALKPILAKIPIEDIVKSIREDREKR